MSWKKLNKPNDLYDLNERKIKNYKFWSSNLKSVLL